jgi:hypothetical protein
LGTLSRTLIPTLSRSTGRERNACVGRAYRETGELLNSTAVAAGSPVGSYGEDERRRPRAAVGGRVVVDDQGRAGRVGKGAPRRVREDEREGLVGFVEGVVDDGDGDGLGKLVGAERQRAPVNRPGS